MDKKIYVQDIPEVSSLNENHGFLFNLNNETKQYVGNFDLSYVEPYIVTDAIRLSDPSSFMKVVEDDGIVDAILNEKEIVLLLSGMYCILPNMIIGFYNSELSEDHYIIFDADGATFGVKIPDSDIDNWPYGFMNDM